MRSLLFAMLLITAAAAAERETFTLKDGRTLVGVYDQNAQAITLDGKGHAVLPLRVDQIKEREPAPAEPAAIAAKPAALAPIEAASDQEPKRQRQSLRQSWAPVQEQLERLRAQESEAEAALIKGWCDRSAPGHVPVPELETDPRESEREANQHARQANALVDRMRDEIRLQHWQVIATMMWKTDTMQNHEVDVYDDQQKRSKP